MASGDFFHLACTFAERDCLAFPFLVNATLLESKSNCHNKQVAKKSQHLFQSSLYSLLFFRPRLDILIVLPI